MEFAYHAKWVRLRRPLSCTELYEKKYCPFSSTHSYVGDTQIPLACEMFVEQWGQKLLEQNLFKNFVLHMCNLFDHGLVSATVHYQVILKLKKMMISDRVRTVIVEGGERQRDHWRTCGYDKYRQQQQQLQHEQLLKATTAAAATADANSRDDEANKKLKELKNDKDKSRSLTKLKSGATTSKGVGSSNSNKLLKKSAAATKTASEDPSNSRRKTTGGIFSSAENDTTNKRRILTSRGTRDCVNLFVFLF